MRNSFFILYICTFLNLTILYAANDTESSDLPQICSPTECYTIIKELGEGAFGKVYSVKNSSGMPYAIKSYKTNPELNFSFDFYRDAQREFTRGQVLKHPYIIASHDLFNSFSSSGESQANIVLDLVEGQTINSIKRKELINDDALKAAMQFIDALQYAYSQGFIHLDLHGGNIMLDNQTDIRVIDLASFFTIEEILSFVKKEAIEDNQQKTSENPSNRQLAKSGSLNLEKAVQDNKVMQDFELESFSMEADHSQKVKATKDYGSKDCVNLLSSTAVSRLNEPTHPKTEKLRKFFKQNRKLFKQLKNESLETNYLKKSLDLSKKTSIAKENIEAYSNELGQLPIQSYYFNAITEICISLITKSDLSREEKINLRAEIKKIVWNYEEDIDEGTNQSLDAYLKELVETLQSK